MASLENGDCQNQHVDTAGTVSDFTDFESLLKREKARTKSNFTRIKKQGIVFNRATGTTQPTRNPGCV